MLYFLISLTVDIDMFMFGVLKKFEFIDIHLLHLKQLYMNLDLLVV